MEAGRDCRPREIDALSNDAGFHAGIDDQTHQMTRCPVLRPSRIRTSDGVYVQARHPGEIARVSRERRRISESSRHTDHDIRSATAR